MTADARTVLLTGATGFLGSHLLRALVDAGRDVVAVVRESSNPWRIADLVPRVRRVTADQEALSAAFDVGIGSVVHVATSFGRKGETSADVVEANVSFPLRLMALAGRHGVRCFLNTDTFLTRSPVAPEGLERYAATKRCFRECGYRDALASGIRYTDLQLEHVYGPDDGETKFLPALMQALLRPEQEFDLTGGEQVRDFVEVSDVVDAYLRVLHEAEHADLPRTIEVGSGAAVTLRSFVEHARDVTRSPTQLRFGALPYRRDELMRSVADTAYLRSLAWQPRVTLEKGLTRVAEAQRRSQGAR